MKTVAARRWMAAEVEALGERLAALPRFASTIPMVFDATPIRQALNVADTSVDRSKDMLAAEIRAFLGVQRHGDPCDLRDVHRRYLTIRGRFNALLSTVDVFADALTQRAEHGIGVALRGLDALAEDGLRIRVPGYQPPRLLCFLDRGAGGAVRRTFTRLPGGEMNEIALIKLPRERLFGVGLASLLHEVAHEGVVRLRLIPPYVSALRTAAERGRVPHGVARWAISKITEILPDLWACAKLGVTATLGIFGVLGGTARATFRDNPLDRHPLSWARGILSAAYGAAAMPHPIWHQLTQLWLTLYPVERAPVGDRQLVLSLAPYLWEIARTIAATRPRQLGGATLHEALGSSGVAPGRLLPSLRQHLAALAPTTPPCQALAVVGLARYRGLIEPRFVGQRLQTLARSWADRAVRTPATLFTPMPFATAGEAS